jgi:hypothetical protein
MKDSVKTFFIISLILFSAIFVATILKYENTVDTLNITLSKEIQNSIETEERLTFLIDSLTCEIDTISYESIDTTVIHWPWGREEVYYFKYEVENLLDAIIQVESRDNDSAYNKGEDAVGCLQIRKTMVDDVNRILRKQGAKDDELYSYEDRWERILSIQMFKIYCEYYTLETSEEISRCWNGGPRGMDKEVTSYYWNKVKSELEDV